VEEARHTEIRTAVCLRFCNGEILRHTRGVAVQTKIKCKASVISELYTVQYTHKDDWSGKEEVYIYI
jgi:hypothetical protein